MIVQDYIALYTKELFTCILSLYLKTFLCWPSNNQLETVIVIRAKQIRKHLISTQFELIYCTCLICDDWVTYLHLMNSSRHLRTPANIIIMNLAISDFFMLIKMPIFLYNSLLQGPALGSRGTFKYISLEQIIVRYSVYKSLVFDPISFKINYPIPLLVVAYIGLLSSLYFVRCIIMTVNR